MASPFDPLASLMTPQQLQLQRAQDWNDQYLNDRKLAQNGQQAGFASLGTAIGQGLSALSEDNDPLMQRAKQNADILQSANQDAAHITDPFERQKQILVNASTRFRSIGAFDTSAQLDASLLQLTQQQHELAQLDAKAASEQAEADTKNLLKPGLVANQTADTNNKIAASGNYASEVAKRGFDMGMVKGQIWFDPKNPTPTPVGINENDPKAVQEALDKGLIPLQGAVLQATKFGDLGSQPIGGQAASDINHGLTNQQNLNQLRDLSESLQGAVDKDGRLNPNAVLQWGQGKLGMNDAVNQWNANYNQLRANVQSLIKGTPSNRDAQIFEATIPELFDPYNVKIAKLDALDNVNKALVRLTIQEHQATKQAVPQEILDEAKSLGIDVGNLPAMTIAQSYAARQKLANSVQQKISGAWGMAQNATKTKEQTDAEFVDGVINGHYKQAPPGSLSGAN